jgi:hypothetical protein
MAKTYTKTKWVNEETPLNADNLNNIEQGIEDAINAANENENKLTQLDNSFKQHEIESISKLQELEGDLANVSQNFETKTQELEECLEEKVSREDLEDLASREDFEYIQGIVEDKADKKDLFDKDYNKLNNKPTIPTKLTDLVNDAGFIKSNEVDFGNFFTKEETKALIAKESHMTMKVVDALPTEGISATTIYLLTKANAEGNNVKKEYIYIEDKWELIGSTEVNLDGFITEEQIDTKINSAITSLLTNKY